jgi:hypothetical protein
MSTVRLFRRETMFVDTPRGIFTSSGVWFHAREGAIREYAEDVFEYESLPDLLHQAEVWLRSPRTLALWVLPAALLAGMPGVAVAGALVLYLAWAVLGPSFVNRPLLWSFRVLDLMPLQLAGYAVVLSVLGIAGHYLAVAVGLAGFILLRWGIVDQMFAPLIERVHRTIYPLPASDQVLRGLLRRAAMKYRVSLPELDRMERGIWDTWYRNK